MAGAAACSGGRAAPAAAPSGAGNATVASVVDGDTFDVRLADGSDERVRIVGVNAPEHDECFADDATAALTARIGGQSVDLVRDHSDRDRYGRLLRYVEVGGVDVGERLVRQGFAIARVSEPDTDRAAQIAAAEVSAIVAGTGLWATDACGPAVDPSVRVGLSALRADADGDDSTNLNDEWVEITNDSTAPVDLTGWVVRDESASHRFAFPDGYSLPPAAAVRLHSGCGPGTLHDLFWCESGSAAWNNSGDTAFLLDPAGTSWITSPAKPAPGGGNAPTPTSGPGSAARQWWPTGRRRCRRAGRAGPRGWRRASRRAPGARGRPGLGAGRPHGRTVSWSVLDGRLVERLVIVARVFQ